jgi:Flp pilus assembly secretin CpaC
MSRLTIALLAAALFAAPVAAAAQSGALNVEIDRSARVQLRGAASSVIVGNPQIADVTVVDANTLFIVGKGYGVTEVVAVDGVGRTLFQREVVVTGGSTGTVRVWRGAQATEMACSASCSPSVRRAEAGQSPGAAAAPVTP